MEDEEPQSLFCRSTRTLHTIEDSLLVVVLLSMVVLAFSQIIMRNVFDIGYIWIDPLLRIMVLWAGMLGAMVATRESKQISVDVLTRILSPRLKLISKVLTMTFASLVCGTIAWYSALFVIDEWKYESIAFASVPAWIPELIIPIAFTIMAIRFALQCLNAFMHLCRKTNQ